MKLAFATSLKQTMIEKTTPIGKSLKEVMLPAGVYAIGGLALGWTIHRLVNALRNNPSPYSWIPPLIAASTSYSGMITGLAIANITREKMTSCAKTTELTFYFFSIVIPILLTPSISKHMINNPITHAQSAHYALKPLMFALVFHQSLNGLIHLTQSVEQMLKNFR